MQKEWYNYYRYVAGATGGGIGTIVGVAVAIWGIYKLGMYHGADCEVEYLGYLFNKQLGDEQYEQCRKGNQSSNKRRLREGKTKIKALSRGEICGSYFYSLINQFGG